MTSDTVWLVSGWETHFYSCIFGLSQIISSITSSLMECMLNDCHLAMLQWLNMTTWGPQEHRLPLESKVFPVDYWKIVYKGIFTAVDLTNYDNL